MNHSFKVSLFNSKTNYKIKNRPARCLTVHFLFFFIFFARRWLVAYAKIQHLCVINMCYWVARSVTLFVVAEFSIFWLVRKS
jgi:hypothetical protein